MVRCMWRKKRAYCVWFDVCERKKELTVYGLMYVKEKQQQSFQCKVQCMQSKNNNRAYSVWFDVCEGKTTTELTVYGSMYVKEKTTELTVCGSMYVKEKQQQSLQCMVQCMWRKKQQSLQCMVRRMWRKKHTELTVYGSMYVKEKQQQSLQCMVRCMQNMASGFHTICSACHVQPAALALKWKLTVKSRCCRRRRVCTANVSSTVHATLNKDSNTAGSFGTWFELFHHPSISNTNNKSIYVLAQNLVQRKYSKHTPAHKYRHPHTWEYYTHWLDTIHSQPTLWTTNRDLRRGKQQQSRKYSRSIGSQKQTSHTHTHARIKKKIQVGEGSEVMCWFQ